MVFVPPRFATDALYEAIESGVDLIVCITEGIPAHDMMRVFAHLRRGSQLDWHDHVRVLAHRRRYRFAREAALRIKSCCGQFAGRRAEEQLSRIMIRKLIEISQAQAMISLAH